MSQLPSRTEAEALLFSHVTDTYQRYHALMVGTALAGYARHFGEDEALWFTTGYLHDLDFQEHPNEHPGQSLGWFREWNYPEALIHAVEAHAFGFNGFTTEPQTRLAAALMACDEICGIFYAYQKLNPVPYGDIKASSILKRLREVKFAPGIKREDIARGCAALDISLEEHVANLVTFLTPLPNEAFRKET